jgi:hypothetical protein
MRKRDRIVLGGALMVIGAAVAIPHLFGREAIWAFVALFVLGVVLVISAIGSRINPAHAEELRAITARLQAVADGDDGDPFRTERERRIYEAHYRRLVEREVAVKAAVVAEAGALSALSTKILTAAQARFPRPEFWFPQDIASKARQRLQGSADHRREIAEGNISAGRPMVSGVTSPQISWGSSPIWVPLSASPAAKATDAELDAKIDDVRAWFAEARDSEAGRVYRDAVLNTRARRTELARAVAKLDGRAVERGRKCTTCRPIRKGQFWR